jgi:hypothetical protein
MVTLPFGDCQTVPRKIIDCTATAKRNTYTAKRHTHTRTRYTNEPASVVRGMGEIEIEIGIEIEFVCRPFGTVYVSVWKSRSESLSGSLSIAIPISIPIAIPILNGRVHVSLMLPEMSRVAGGTGNALPVLRSNKRLLLKAPFVPMKV